MILILTNDGDVSADLVIDWLNNYNHPFIRIHSSDFIDGNFLLDTESDVISFGNKSFAISEIGAVWFRKFGFFNYTNLYEEMSKSMDYRSLFHLTKEFSLILGAFISRFSEKKWFTNPKKVQLNKFEVNLIAKKNGLNIPKTFLVNSKEKLTYLKKLLKSDVISKSILDPLFVFEEEYCYGHYTQVVTDDFINKLSDKFLPSLIQEKIEKKYELRVFYIEGKCYSMAIFSQNDALTKIDFRKYNHENSNRYVPYILPKEIEYKLDLLMKEIGLNNGSIDLIKSTDDDYVFLEINPTGQFGMTDFPCNYGLHKLVAETLIKYDKNETVH
jgi:ATP-GRASP peptide maturase of grasp-with-spasm system